MFMPNFFYLKQCEIIIELLDEDFTTLYNQFLSRLPKFSQGQWKFSTKNSRAKTTSIIYKVLMH